MLSEGVEISAAVLAQRRVVEKTQAGRVRRYDLAHAVFIAHGDTPNHIAVLSLGAVVAPGLSRLCAGGA